MGRHSLSSRSRSRFVLLVAAFALAVMAIVFLGGIAAYAGSYSGKALPRTTVAGTNVSGQTASEIEQDMKDRGVTRTVSFTVGKQTTIASLADMGIRVDASTTAQEALKPSAGFWNRVVSVLGSRDIPATITIDEAAFNAFVSSLNEQTPSPVAEPSIALEGEQFVVVPGERGTAVDASQVRDFASSCAKTLTTPSAKDLSIVEAEPSISASEAEAAAARANEMADVSVKLTGSSTSFIASPADAAKWVTFTEPLTPSYDVDAIKEWVASAAAKTYVQPKAGVRTVSDTGEPIYVVQEGEKGSEASNVEALAGEILAAINAGEAFTGSFEYEPVEPDYAPQTIPAGEKWIDVNLTTNQMTCYEGGKVVHGPTPIVPGKPTMPTVTGTFKVWHQMPVQTMRGTDENGDPYVEPDVPWITYFHGDYAIHAAPWRDSFGWSGPGGSHGCVNAPTEAAEWIYHWVEMGTKVVSHY